MMSVVYSCWLWIRWLCDLSDLRSGRVVFLIKSHHRQRVSVSVLAFLLSVGVTFVQAKINIFMSWAPNVYEGSARYCECTLLNSASSPRWRRHNSSACFRQQEFIERYADTQHGYKYTTWYGTNSINNLPMTLTQWVGRPMQYARCCSVITFPRTVSVADWPFAPMRVWSS